MGAYFFCCISSCIFKMASIIHDPIRKQYKNIEYENFCLRSKRSSISPLSSILLGQECEQDNEIEVDFLSSNHFFHNWLCESKR